MMTSLLPLQIAEITHGANRSYSRHAGCKNKQRWNRLDALAHKRVEKGVLYAIDHPDCSPADIHDHWVATMLRDGWEPGGVVDHGARVHRNLVPWDELTPREQHKDVLFLAIVRALAPPRSAQNGDPEKAGFVNREGDIEFE